MIDRPADSVSDADAATDAVTGAGATGAGAAGGNDPHRYASVALLVDLVTNTLDPGYREATERRRAAGTTAAASGRRRIEHGAFAVACALLGLLLAVAYVQTHQGAPAAKQVHDRLVTRVRSADANADALSKQARSLNAELEKIRRAALSGSQRTALDRTELAAGMVGATGPGITVTLGLPKAVTPSAGTQSGRSGTTPITSTALINDRDVRAVVNELWADGAQAMSVNDVRLTPTSAVRFAGQAVLVDFQPLLPPYVIRAIGDRSRLITSFADSSVASRYQTLITARGITFTFVESGKLSLPAVPGAELRYARPVPAR